jgi:hypothetical protein
MQGISRTAAVLALSALVASGCQLDARESDRILQQSACDKLRHLGTAASEHARGVVADPGRLRLHAENTLMLTELSDELAQSRFGEPLREHRGRVDRAFVTQNLAGAGQRDGAPPWADIAADAEELWDEFGCAGDVVATVAAEAAPPPAEECRELGGGWRWEGSRDRGTTSVSLAIDRDDLDAEADGAILTAAPADDEELAERWEERAAAGWTEERVRGLSYLGVAHRVAAERGFDGDAAEYADVQDDLQRRLDASPRCGREVPTSPSD